MRVVLLSLLALAGVQTTMAQINCLSDVEPIGASSCTSEELSNACAAQCVIGDTSLCGGPITGSRCFNKVDGTCRITCLFRYDGN